MGDDQIPITAQHLKQVSRIKHLILEKYLPPWSRILGSQNAELAYFDCYAGPGIYELKGEFVEGSPIIAVQAARDFLIRYPERRMAVSLFEDDPGQCESLQRELVKCQPYPDRLRVQVFLSDTKDIVIEESRKFAFAPTFFLIDPYGHPLTIPIINSLLAREKTEALINFMFYRINMDAENTRVQHHLDEMFGSAEWRSQPFREMRGLDRERSFLNYFCSRIAAKYAFPFRIKFDPEDRLSSDRTKYYLVHVSNHPTATLLMKEVMSTLGDEKGTFEFGQSQANLFPSTPTIDDLKTILLEAFHGRTLSFGRIREETWRLPCVEKQYRNAIKSLRDAHLVEITPVTSKTEKGLTKADRVKFL